MIGMNGFHIDGIDTSRSFNANSGYYLSRTQFLSLDTNHVFAEDIMDLNSYRTPSPTTPSCLTPLFTARM